MSHTVVWLLCRQESLYLLSIYPDEALLTKNCRTFDVVKTRTLLQGLYTFCYTFIFWPHTQTHLCWNFLLPLMIRRSDGKKTQNSVVLGVICAFSMSLPAQAAVQGLGGSLPGGRAVWRALGVSLVADQEVPRYRWSDRRTNYHALNSQNKRKLGQ